MFRKNPSNGLSPTRFQRKKGLLDVLSDVFAAGGQSLAVSPEKRYIEDLDRAAPENA